MNTRRLLGTAALLTAAVATLTACDPSDAPAAPGATASATASATAGATPSTAPTASVKPTASTSAKPSAAKPSASHTGAAPANCTTAAQRPGHRVINVTAGTADKLTATATTFICGPDIDNDGYYQATGAASSYSFASGATAQLVTVSGAVGTGPVSVAALVQHVNDCAAHHEPAAPYSCFGGMYDITTDASGKITAITELYHP
ncbi:hypothetical protein AB0K51_15420 [Kitasatospora sp. NPDC049285]|uniref:hypothetical protein n=1 Tax=Kitasatospora sp. NPDC049285 TaxID=3157096 RepID=UPI0034484F44